MSKLTSGVEKIKELERRIEFLEETVNNLKTIIRIMSKQLNDLRKEIEKPKYEKGIPKGFEKVLKVMEEAGEKGVTAWDLADRLNISRSRASEILNSLYRAGIIEKERIGKQTVFQLPSTRLKRG